MDIDEINPEASRGDEPDAAYMSATITMRGKTAPVSREPVLKAQFRMLTGETGRTSLLTVLNMAPPVEVFVTVSLSVYFDLAGAENEVEAEECLTVEGARWWVNAFFNGLPALELAGWQADARNRLWKQLTLLHRKYGAQAIEELVDDLVAAEEDSEELVTQEQPAATNTPPETPQAVHPCRKCVGAMKANAAEKLYCPACWGAARGVKKQPEAPVAAVVKPAPMPDPALPQALFNPTLETVLDKAMSHQGAKNTGCFVLVEHPTKPGELTWLFPKQVLKDNPALLKAVLTCDTVCALWHPTEPIVYATWDQTRKELVIEK
jgi:hypothetical protein